jgi:SAM-dependent methyltransferase
MGREVVALDLSKYSILTLRRVIESNFLHVVRGDILRMPFRDCVFDMVYNEGVVEHFQNSMRVVREMVRVTKKKGIVLISVPNFLSFHTFARQVLARFFTETWKKRLWPYGFERSFSRNYIRHMLQLTSLSNVEVHGLGLFYGLARYTPYRFYVMLYSLYVRLRGTKMAGFLTEYFGFQIAARGEKISPCE